MSKSKARIQNYLRQNKISELFEDMMGRLIRDLPASPIYYLVNFLQEKEKAIKHIVRDEVFGAKEKELEMTSNAKLWATTPAPVKKPAAQKNSSPQQRSTEGRKYDKPWLTQSNKSPSKSGKLLQQTAPVSVSKSDVLDWSQKTRISTESTDKGMNGDDGVDLGLVYTKPKFVGETQVKIRSTEEEMQEEASLSGAHRDEASHSIKSTHTKISAKQAKRIRLEELRRLADKTHPKPEQRSNSPIVVDDGTEDDALEVLEDADELMSEGIKNPPKTGVVSRSGQKPKEEIELVLNMSKFFDELGGMEGINQSQVNGSNVQNQYAEDDEDFESASQVTGPRRPVWEAPQSEVESVASQLRSARISSDISLESFVALSDSAAKPDEDPKPEKSKHKTSEPRPRTAPSKSRSNVERNLSNGNGSVKKSVKASRSQPTTPKGSVVGSGRARQGLSHTVINPSEPAATPPKKDKNVKEKSKKKTSDLADDVPDSKPN